MAQMTRPRENISLKMQHEDWSWISGAAKRSTFENEFNCPSRPSSGNPLLTHKVQIRLHHLRIATGPRWTGDRFTGVRLVHVLCKLIIELTGSNGTFWDPFPEPTYKFQSCQFPGALLRDQDGRRTHILVDHMTRVVEEGERLDDLQDSVFEFNVQELVLLHVIGFGRSIRRRLLWRSLRRSSRAGHPSTIVLLGETHKFAQSIFISSPWQFVCPE